MRVPLSWLKEFVEINLPVSELAEKLTFANLEVESIDYIGLPGAKEGLTWDRDKIWIGQLVQVLPHPNADRLTLAIVDYGQAAPIQVVTGAPNIKVGDRGQKVVLALEGARLYDGHKPGREIMTLKKSKIRGVESGSMVCSEKELGLSEEHEGIILLPDDAPVGTPFADYLGDIVLDIKINPNMARCQSVLGIAREVAALTGQRVRERGKPAAAVVSGADTRYVRIEIEDATLCARYSAALIRRVAIKPAPLLMQRRLILAGMRPIGNIVDITNYVMIERGQPLHAFDYDKLVARAGGKPTIIVRPAHLGERMKTLDGVMRELKPTDLLITDTAGPIAIAGVMGGAETEVSDETRTVLLEAANFDFISVRRTTQEQKLPSEAATRFGRGISPVQTIPGALRACELMGRLAEGDIDPVVADNYVSPLHQPAIPLTAREVERLLGISLSEEQITAILESLDFKVERPGGDVLLATPPDYRLDVIGSADLTEEVLRIHGYDRIPSTLMSDELPPQRTNILLEREEQARTLLINSGLVEVVTYGLTSPEREALLTLPGYAQASAGEFDPRPAQPYLVIENPLSPERSVMRQTLLTGMLDALASNLRFTRRAGFFEIGKVYLTRAEGDDPDGLPEDRGLALPHEKLRLGIIMTGPREEPFWQQADSAQMDFYDLKGVVEEFVRGLHEREVSYAATQNPLFHPGRGAALMAGAARVGVLGELHPLVRERWDLPPQAVLVAEIDLEALLGQMDPRFRVEPISRYPSVVQDIAMIVGRSIAAERIAGLIRQTGGSLLGTAVLFDVYEGGTLPPGKKSLAYRLSFQAPDRVLSDTDVAKLRDKIVARLMREVGAELRSS